jgi:hypothetical protein
MAGRKSELMSVCRASLREILRGVLTSFLDVRNIAPDETEHRVFGLGSPTAAGEGFAAGC